MQSFSQSSLEKNAKDPLRREVAIGRTFYVGQADVFLDKAYLGERESVKTAIIRQPEQIAEAVTTYATIEAPLAAQAATHPAIEVDPFVSEDATILDVEQARRNVDYIHYLTEEGVENNGSPA